MSQELMEKIVTILHAANDNPLLTSEIHHKLCTEYNYKKSVETVRRSLIFMKKQKIVSQVVHPEKNIPSWIVKETEHHAVNSDTRIRHSDYLKNHIICPWLEQLPTKNELIFLWSEDIFPVEKEEMFQDLKNHINSDYGNPFTELDIFKQILHQFLIKKREIQSLSNDIFESIKNDFFDKKVAWRWNLSAMTDFIIDRTIRDRNMDFRSIFVDDFTSHLEEKNWTFLYYTMDYPDEMIDAVGGELNKKKFKESMDKFVKKLLENAKDSEHIQNEITVLCELLEKLFDHIEKMRKSLKKHLALGILPGNCEYCL